MHTMQDAENFELGVARPVYDGTSRAIAPGDHITFDGHEGIVDSVFLPNTDLAEAFSCKASGGILVRTQEYGLMTIPFGYPCWIAPNDKT